MDAVKIFEGGNCSNLKRQLNAGDCVYFNIIRKLFCLPLFIIAGTMKSGTGELMKWLNIHPSLISGKSQEGKREIHFFTGKLNSSSDCLWMDYIKMFPVDHHKDKVDSTIIPNYRMITFDKSPDYIRNKVK